jgi:beta-lactamase superfamily II metal-dependent hydrolase
VPIVKSYAVGAGDMFYIRHGSDNFTIIDCDLTEDNAEQILADIKMAMTGKTVVRFICTHPDEDHFGGLHRLDDAIGVLNFYVVKNQAVKDEQTESFIRYCKLRDDPDKAFYISKGCQRRWMNLSDDERQTSCINVLWPDTSNLHFKEALAACDAGDAYNNTSAVVRYEVKDGASILWLGDLETQFMENIVDDIDLAPTTVVFASHHGRQSGKIPDSWLDQLKPRVIVIGEAPSRHLHYYTGYTTLTQNSAGDITMDCGGDMIDFYVSSDDYAPDGLSDEGRSDLGADRYIGSITAKAR